MELSFNYKRKDTTSAKETIELSALYDADSSFFALWAEDDLLSASMNPSGWDAQEFLKSSGFAIRKNKVAVLNNNFTLVPNTDFDFSGIEDYLTFNVQNFKDRNLIIRTDLSEVWDLRVVYAVPRSLLREINDFGEQTSLCHMVTAVIDHLDISSVTEWSIHNIVLKNKTIVLAFHKARLILVNVYYTEDPLSLLYYNSLITHQLAVSKNSLSIRLSGLVDPDGPIQRLLKKYFNNISFDSCPGLDEGLSHPYLPLFCIKRCA